MAIGRNKRINNSLVVGSHNKKKRKVFKMRHYLENRKFYVEKADEKLVYVVRSYETFSNSTSIHINLELVAGWDYLNPDESNTQGWCPHDRFVEDVQDDVVAQYFLAEGMYEALKWHDYEVLEEIDPDLQKIIDKYLEN